MEERNEQEDVNKVLVYVDGSCIGNNDKKAVRTSFIAIVVVENKIEIMQQVVEVVATTNNQAEYWAVIKGCDFAYSHFPKKFIGKFTVLSDSKLVVEQIAGRYNIKDLALRDLCNLAKKSLQMIGGKIEWIPREQNLAGKLL